MSEPTDPVVGPAQQIDLGIYRKNLQLLTLLQSNGPLGVKVIGLELFPRTWWETVQAYAALFVSIVLCRENTDLQATLAIAQRTIKEINTVHKGVNENSDFLEVYFSAERVIRVWNKQFGTSDSILGKVHGWMLNGTKEKWMDAASASCSVVFSDTISASNTGLPEEHFVCAFITGQKLPIMVSPKNHGISFSEFCDLLQKYQKEIQALTAKYGAVLFRGFPVKDASGFSMVLERAAGKAPMDYLAGEGSRTKVAPGVYTSTEAPSGFKIPLHNELSCTTKPPPYISFYCEQPPLAGTGQTILGSTNRITQTIQKERPEVWRMFEDKTVQYISRHPPTGSWISKVNRTHKTWNDSFETSDKQRVEAICQTKKYDFKWIGDWLEVTREAPCTRPNPDKPNEKMWFNQFHLYHANPIIRGGWLTHLLANLLYFRPQTRQYDVQLVDGTPLPEDSVCAIYPVLDGATEKFDWFKGDWLLVDNIRALHGRDPYSGDRRILTAMVEA